jgi:ABC-type Zn uptake system ZnuABC Zn-binding protein ZnuA
LRHPAFLALLCLLFSACSPAGGFGAAGPARSGAERPTVSTSTTLLADLVRNVVGDHADVVSVVPVGRNPHDYEPSAADAVAISRASVFFANGLHYEAFLAKLLENATSSVSVVTLSEGLQTLNSDIDHGDHNHLFPNPYLYLDVRNAMAYVEKIRDAMAARDPRNADAYRANAGAYLAELEQLDAWIMGEVARVPEPKRRLMKDHDSFPYYAERYGFASWAASYEGTQEAAPSASQYATLIGQVHKFGITVVFGEEGFSSKLLHQLVQDTGIRYVSGLHAATVGTTDETDSYVDVMRWNTRLIVEQLQ